MQRELELSTCTLLFPIGASRSQTIATRFAAGAFVSVEGASPAIFEFIPLVCRPRTFGCSIVFLVICLGFAIPIATALRLSRKSAAIAILHGKSKLFQLATKAVDLSLQRVETRRYIRSASELIIVLRDASLVEIGRTITGLTAEDERFLAGFKFA